MNTIKRDAGLLTMIWRGVRIRCPRCGGGKLFKSFFKLKERCPTCGYKIVREEGFWLGGYVMNVVIGEGLLAIYLLIFAARVIANPDLHIRPWLAGAIALAIIPPALFFPMSRTTWMAMDLQMHPLEPYEVAEADLALEDMKRGGS
ncbi:MAG: DUF983 domain-containing protein [Actinobacteria bacterium]|nr:DUF983 domain-containing protein [Actinomycetota bacterium]